MNDEIEATQSAGHKPLVVHPGPPSIEDLLRSIDPAPDDETERFVAAIYADRREAIRNSRSE
jgi:hypothetical protein